MSEIAGRPLHIMMLHAPLVTIPLLIVVTLVFLYSPKSRPTTYWAVYALSILGFVTTLLTGLFGLLLRNSLVDKGLQGTALDKINSHGAVGLYFVILGSAFCVLSFFLIFSVRRMSMSGRWTNKDIKSLNVIRVLYVLTSIVVLVLMVMAADKGAALVYGF